MAIEVGLWRIDNGCTILAASAMDLESRLEEILVRDIGLVDPGLLLIGRQVLTPSGKRIDLLALNANGDLVVLELKRSKTPREVVAQLLDYAFWARSFRNEDIARIYSEMAVGSSASVPAPSLDDAFRKRFSLKSMPDELNTRHALIIVASSLDEETERIVKYLAEEGDIEINAIFFRVFRDGEREYLARAWLREPMESDLDAGGGTPTGSWNNEYYVSFGHDEKQDWEEARKFGFVSAYGGSWYTRSLSMLESGARIWVNVPAEGYVGVGVVEEPAVPVDAFEVDDGSGRRVPITSLPIKAAGLPRAAQGPDRAAHLVRVRWLKTVSLEAATHEKGFFGNQNSAARPRSPRWERTVQRLKALFGVQT